MAQAKSKALAALAAAVSSLPAYAAEGDETSYRFSVYSEADLAGSNSADGNAKERYEIETHQLGFRSALNDTWQLDSELMIETMSGASPWFVIPDSQRGAVQVMSGASISEERYALSVGLGRDTGGDLCAFSVHGTPVGFR